jgi:ubiquinone/menaquinone biosynthesis C-methylase UbiE
MAAFRKGNNKVVKYLVRQVRQFPSDADCRRLISTITDKVKYNFRSFRTKNVFIGFIKKVSNMYGSNHIC